MFYVGDRVAWSSQAGGTKKLKEGVIVRFVAPGQDIDDLLDELNAGGEYNTTKLRNDRGNCRRRVSYLIAVRETANSRPRIYWPLAERLERLDEAG